MVPAPGTESESVKRTCVCLSVHDHVAAATQRMSTHRTSDGYVAYYRCYCGRPGVSLIRVPPRRNV